MYILPFTFFGSLLRFREVSSTNYSLYGRKDTLFIVPFFRGTLGHSAAGEQEASLIAVQYILTFGL